MRRRLPILLALAALAAAPALSEGAQTPLIFTLAGGDQNAFAGDGQPASSALLNGPAGLDVQGDGSITIADTINQRIRVIDPTGRIRTIAGTGKRGFEGDGGPATQAVFQDPSAIAYAPDRSLYIADTGNSRVRVIKPDGTVTTVAGTSDQGFSGDGGRSTAAQVNGPAGVAVMADGSVVFSDTGNNRVRRIRPDGIISTIAGNGTRGFAGDGGPAAAAQLNAPAGLAVDVDGGILVADSGNNRIRRIAADGTIATVAGNGGGGSGGDGGLATSAQLNRPLGVAGGVGRGFLIAETGGHRVRTVGQDGVIQRLAGTGGPRFGGDGRSPGTALLNAPRAVALLPSGREVVIADSDNDRVRYVATPGTAGFLALAPRKAVLNAPLRKVKIKVKKRTRRILVVSDARIPYAVSLKARVTVVIRRKKPAKRVARFSASAKAGVNRLALPARLRRGRHRLAKDHYVVRMTVTAGGQSATKSLELVVR